MPVHHRSCHNIWIDIVIKTRQILKNWRPKLLVLLKTCQITFYVSLNFQPISYPSSSIPNLQYQQQTSAMFFKKSQQQSFHPFRNFPREIRTLIWKEVLNEPRVIEVKIVGYFRGEWPSTAPGKPGINVCFPKFAAVGARYPAIFSTCQESRWVSTKCYEFCLSTVLPPDVDIKPQFHPLRPPKEVTPLLWLCLVPGFLYSCICQVIKREKKRRQCGTPRFPPSPQYLSMGVLFQPQIDYIFLRDVPQCHDWWRAFWSLRDYPVDIDIGGIQSLAVENNFLTHKSNVFNLAISSVQRQKTKCPAVPFKFSPKL